MKTNILALIRIALVAGATAFLLTSVSSCLPLAIGASKILPHPKGPFDKD
ncbi:MAG: hypothetical protein ACSHX7_09515 [Luteolibacter sp.]